MNTNKTPLQILNELETGLSAIFEQIEIAENVIERYLIENPENMEAIWGSFMALKPVKPMLTDLLTFHCEELLNRVIAGDDMTTMTEAEIFMLLSAMLNNAPMRLEHSALFSHLFGKFYPGKQTPDMIIAESYAGQNRDTLELIRKDCPVNDREPVKARKVPQFTIDRLGL